MHDVLTPLEVYDTTDDKPRETESIHQGVEDGHDLHRCGIE